MDVFRALLHDAPDPGSSPDPTAHRALLDRADGWTVGPLVVPDERLAGLGTAGDLGVTLSVLIGGGAGGLTALARRAETLPLVSAETVLRDLDDLAGNAGRVAAAATGLGDGVEVYVGVPAARGAVEAVEVVEAAGLLGRVSLAEARGGTGAGAQLSVLVEADLPFKATGLGADPFGAYGLVALLMAVEALVDGADPRDADALLGGVDEQRATNALAAWDAATSARVRRRLHGVDCADVAGTLERLGAAGLLGG
ncbi:hypothetical protein GCM10022197_28350 [Microlunatus spumicola]|uniref:Uncharacterized protein n=1 Tax=Microlunatus spumicola TaxID=81499 RepID=A0ABP6XP70_9ACTN